MNKYKKEIKRRVLSIITTTIFLIGSTYCWFNFKKFDVDYLTYKDETIMVSKEIAFSDLEKVSDKDLAKVTSYNFDVANTGTSSRDIKITIVPDLLYKNISNNYVKYSINGGIIHSLNMDGIIYVDKIQEDEVKNIDLKVWISENYKGKLNYNGRVIVS